jgi:hypothetical protein
MKDTRQLGNSTTCLKTPVSSFATLSAQPQCLPTINYAYTAPFTEDSKITHEQAFKALHAKARAPVKFIPALSSNEILEETPEFIKRRATTKTGEVLVEDIYLYAPSLVQSCHTSPT